MFFAGVLNLFLGVGMIAAAFVAPVGPARWGLVLGGAGLAASGWLLIYLDAPSRKDKPPPGKQRAKATILDAAVLPGAVAGYQMVELTLEVKPKDGLPLQVKRKFSSGRLGRVEQGRRIDVLYDPADPEKIELA